eukprot:TRINITY_DN5492_c0_g1_i1.p1 TRINITY_DN5492_c0_g1~~TRINITY_DN5492_c0_g1_i1.p1  ORF type:complete len:297 (-),score=73.52 TRINITY_DN5492_c0_g1_i1:50-940(-)
MLLTTRRGIFGKKRLTKSVYQQPQNSNTLAIRNFGSTTPFLVQMRSTMADNRASPTSGLNKKLKRQKKCVMEIINMGFDYDGPLNGAKERLNKILLDDARVYNLKEIGNGNVRNLKDRLMPLLAKECKKKNLKQEGSYADLRNRVYANTKVFANDGRPPLAMEKEKKGKIKYVLPGKNGTFVHVEPYKELEATRNLYFAERLNNMGIEFTSEISGAREVLLNQMKEDCKALGITFTDDFNIHDLNGCLVVHMARKCRELQIPFTVEQRNYVDLRNILQENTNILDKKLEDKEEEEE